MAVEHVKTWEGAGWMLSFRDNGHNDDDNAPTHTRRAPARCLIYRLNHDRRVVTRRGRSSLQRFQRQRAPELNVPYGDARCGAVNGVISLSSA